MEPMTIYYLKTEFKKIADYLHWDIFSPKESISNVLEALDDLEKEIVRLKTRNVILSLEISKLKEETFVSEKEETFVSEDLFEMAENLPNTPVLEEPSFFKRWLKKN